MGWCSGSDVFDDIWSIVREHIPDENKVEVCSEIIISLQRRDWDCECDFVDSEEYPEFNESFRLAEEFWQKRRDQE